MIYATRRILPCLAALLVALSPAVALGEALAFITVEGEEAADERLAKKLELQLDQALDLRPYDYEGAIDALADQGRGQESTYLARLTPYVYITAEMLGADLEILGTYHSQATDQETYHAYFVVNRKNFPGMKTEDLELRDLLAFLRQGTRHSFIYHNRFSTSSYFLPSLYFRQNRIFHMKESTDRLTAIRSVGLEAEQIGSSDLVERVAAGQASFAAVWDGTKSKFMAGRKKAIGKKVHFIRLPTLLPNDLLVCSAGLDEGLKKKIRDALAGQDGKPGLSIDRGDVEYWVPIDAADSARAALGDLRSLARKAPAPVTVQIQAADDDDLTRGWLREAARQAVRLSGTEFVLFNKSFHEQVDYAWQLQLVREGYLKLESTIRDAPELSQTFYISFHAGSLENLAVRLNRYIHSRIHRVRYLWPYEKKNPLVIRDVLFSLPAESPVKVQSVRWRDPQRNDYLAGASHQASIKGSDPYKFSFGEGVYYLINDPKTPFDPMSNVAYRVILVRPEEPGDMFRVFNVLLYGLLAASALGSVVALRGQEA